MDYPSGAKLGTASSRQERKNGSVNHGKSQSSRARRMDIKFDPGPQAILGKRIKR